MPGSAIIYLWSGRLSYCPVLRVPCPLNGNYVCTQTQAGPLLPTTGKQANQVQGWALEIWTGVGRGHVSQKVDLGVGTGPEKW